MKIAHACDLLADYGGNFISSLMSINDAAKRSGTPLETIFIFPQGREHDDLEWLENLKQKYKVYFIPRNSVFAIAKAIYKICKNEKVDILHAHFYDYLRLGLAGLLTPTKVVCHYHCSFWKSENRFKELIRKMVRSVAVDKYVGCSKATMDSIICGGVPQAKCTYVTNRIDFSRLDIQHNSEPFDKSKTNILMFGTWYDIKGCDLALHAIEPIADEYNITLHIVGHHLDELQANIKQTMGYLPEWVHCTPTTEYIGDYYRNSQIFLSPSRDEGFCTSVVEASYCNCPIIKSDIAALVHGIDGEDQIRVPLNAEALRAKIIEILTMSPEQRKLMTDSFREQVIAKYDITAWGEEVLQIYKDVLK